MKALIICIASILSILAANGQSTFPAKSQLTDTSAPTARRLDSIVVRGQKALFQQLPFGTVVNVGSSVLSKGSSALQVLERSPGVTIDYRYNSISLNGKSGITVMIDGKPMHLSIDQVVSLLNGMSADDIEKIELMTTPPAKYDADGSAGIINIVLKKDRRTGTNGTFSLTQGYGWVEKDVANLSLANNHKNVGFYGSYTFTHDRGYNYLFGKSYSDFPPLGGPMDIEFHNTSRPLQNNNEARLGFDARGGTKSSFGGSLDYSNLNSSSNSHNTRFFTILPDSLLSFDGTVNATNRWSNLLSSAWFEQTLGKNEKLGVDFDYLYYRNNNPTNVESSFFNKSGEQAGPNNDTTFAPNQRGFAHTFIRVGIGKADYQDQVSKKLKLETGLKTSYTNSTSTSAIQSQVNGEWIDRPETSNNMVMTEAIGAAYVSGDYRPTSTLNVTGGLRYEYSRTRMTDPVTGTTNIDRRLGLLFPSILLSGTTGDNTGYTLSYTKRISRPTYNDLSSFVAYNDPVSVFTGNQFLKPTITNNIKLGYHYHGYAVTILASHDDYPIARWQATASPTGDLLYISPQNLNFSNNLSLQLDLPWKPFTWWTININGIARLVRFKETYTPLPVEKTWFVYNVHGSQTFNFTGSLVLELSGWYTGSSYEGSVKNAPVGTVDGAIKKELPKNQGIFQLSITDIFKTVKYKNYYGALTPDPFDGHSWDVYNPESRQAQIIKLTYTRPFGTGSVKTPRIPDTGSQDQQNRVRKN
jgi:outer membrane receptor protein involved in Fe transport